MLVLGMILAYLIIGVSLSLMVWAAADLEKSTEDYKRVTHGYVYDQFFDVCQGSWTKFMLYTYSWKATKEYAKALSDNGMRVAGYVAIGGYIYSIPYAIVTYPIVYSIAKLVNVATASK